MTNLTSQFFFHFIKKLVINLIVDLIKAVGLIINEAILTKTDIAIGFFKLFLW